MTRFVVDYTAPGAPGKDLLGGKGAGLAEMTRIGLPVPAGFTVTTEACVLYMKAGRTYPPGLMDEVGAAMGRLQTAIGKRLGDPADPLLVSVRSGAAISMPGMMDTVLNLGLNDRAVEGLTKRTGNRRFALDAYRRLIQMYGAVVEGLDHDRFSGALAELKRERRVTQDVELAGSDLEVLVGRFKEMFEEGAGRGFPQDPEEQLERALRAVFDSWDSPRARVYRAANAISDDLGTAVNVVQMVFGNTGEDSGTGVAFTRDPSTGEKMLWGEFLANAQGEDVVAGIRTPEPLARMRERLPKAFDELTAAMATLEQHYRDVQDIEFTVEHGTLYLLQTRTAKRTAAAALKVAVDMVGEGLITREEAVSRVEPAQLDHLLHPRIDPATRYAIAARGLNASPGAATGQIALDADRAEELGRRGVPVILVRRETTPDDIHGMIQSRGVLTTHGGMTSHAAVVARGMGKPCVAGCEGLQIDEKARTVKIGRSRLKEGDTITIDGGAGYVILDSVRLTAPELDENFSTLIGWADELRRLRVFANADTPEDARRARGFGAEGIGLCRTEHMFMAEERLQLFRSMIMAETEHDRAAVLEKLLPFQQKDFEGIFEAMSGLPVTIRLLDPPLHEFLPGPGEADTPEMARRAAALRETNPMLGTRGCRLGLLYPEIYVMQVRAILRAAKAVEARSGVAPHVEIMHPLVGFAEEMRRLRDLTIATAEEEDAGHPLVGSMIELPRACLKADEIAAHADFFSFGTNDLTQTTLGLSRDDAEGRFLSNYIADRVLEANPFETLDSGVSDLMRIGVARARSARPDVRLGICGEHGGDPRSVALCHGLELDYVSCSPFRVPLARLAAAQAAIADAATTPPAQGSPA